MLYGTSSRNPFLISILWGQTEDVPPTIVFGLPAGSAVVEPTGALAVFPGSILHLECLFARKLGNPEWTWTSTFRRYLTGESLGIIANLKSETLNFYIINCKMYTDSNQIVPSWMLWNLNSFWNNLYFIYLFCRMGDRCTGKRLEVSSVDILRQTSGFRNVYVHHAERNE